LSVGKCQADIPRRLQGFGCAQEAVRRGIVARRNVWQPIALRQQSSSASAHDRQDSTPAPAQRIANVSAASPAMPAQALSKQSFFVLFFKKNCFLPIRLRTSAQDLIFLRIHRSFYTHVSPQCGGFGGTTGTRARNGAGARRSVHTPPASRTADMTAPCIKVVAGRGS